MLTGGVGWTGAGIVVALAARGFDVAVSDRAKDEALAEGLTATPMTGVAQARFGKLLEEGFTPINRWGTPEDVGKAVATMAAGDLPFTTGAAIPVDGGMHIHQYQ